MRVRSCARAHTDVIGLFGSIARGNETPVRTIDIPVKIEREAGLFGLLELSIFLEELLQHKVDVVLQDSLGPELRESIRASVVALQANLMARDFRPYLTHTDDE